MYDCERYLSDRAIAFAMVKITGVNRPLSTHAPSNLAGVFAIPLPNCVIHQKFQLSLGETVDKNVLELQLVKIGFFIFVGQFTFFGMYLKIIRNFMILQ